MIPWAIILLIAIVRAEECNERCERLKKRTLDRIGFDENRLNALLERQRPLSTMKDVCWRLYDNLDCMKRCPTTKNHTKFAKTIKNKCSFALRDMEANLQCVSRHHSFLNVRCRSFGNEATTLRKKSDLGTTPDRETCRFLHLNTFCLENAVSSYCPKAKKLFRRLHFRDYFLNFLLPEEDLLFDDDDLDSCQLYNFVKGQEDEEENETTTRINLDDDYDEEDELTTIVNHMESTTTKSNTPISTSTSSPTSSAASKEKQEFTTLLNELLQPSSNEINTKSSEDTYTTSENPTTSSEVTTTTTDLPTSSEEITIPTDLSTNSEKPHSNLSPSFSTELVTPSSSEENEPETALNSPHPSEGTDYEYSEGYDDVEDDDESTSSVNVVPIEERVTKESTTTLSTTTSKKRVFSDDSMENTPPNFFYSSLRNTLYSTSTHPNHRFVSDNTNPEDSDEVPTLEIDTTTLFGIENDTTTIPTTESSEGAVQIVLKTKKGPQSQTRVTSTTTVGLGVTTPLLRGEIVVKPIRKKSEPDAEEAEAEQRRQRLRLNRGQTSSKMTSAESEDVVEPQNTLSSGDRRTLIAILSILCTVAILTVLCAICCFCRKSKSHQLN